MSSDTAPVPTVDAGSPGVPSPIMDVPGVVNLRDVGGHSTRTGARVRTGLLYRSGQLAHVDHEATRRLESLGLRIVFDLRGNAELESVPDTVLPGARSVHLDVLRDAQSSMAAHLEDLFTDTAAADELLRGADIESHYLTTYRGLVNFDSARSAYREMFTMLADSSDVALFHCTAGKDRTGWAAAALLTVLGVDAAEVEADFLRSSEPVVASFRPYIDRFAEAGGDGELLANVFRVEPTYLAAAMSEVHEHYGDIEGYFVEGLQVDAEVVPALRARLLTGDAA